MSIDRSFSVVCFAFLFIGALTSPAVAQEIDNVEQQVDVVSLLQQAKRPLWDATMQTEWLPASSIRETGGDFSMQEVKVGFARRFTITPRLELSAGLHYALTSIDAPDYARLPGSLQALSVSFGGEYRTSDRLTLGVRISPGLSSDFKAVSASDLRVPVALTGRYRFSQELTWQGGLAYTGGNRAFPVLPIIGVLYTPSEKLALALGFPRTSVIVKPRKGLDFHLGIERAGGEYRLHDASLGANIISYRDFRGVAGVDLALLSSVKLGVSGGYSFARKLAFFEGNRDDLHLDSAPLGRIEIKFAW